MADCIHNCIIYTLNKHDHVVLNLEELQSEDTISNLSNASARILLWPMFTLISLPHKLFSSSFKVFTIIVSSNLGPWLRQNSTIENGKYYNNSQHNQPSLVFNMHSLSLSLSLSLSSTWFLLWWHGSPQHFDSGKLKTLLDMLDARLHHAPSFTRLAVTLFCFPC